MPAPGSVRRVDAAAQPEPVDILLETELGQNFGDPQRQFMGVGDAGALVVDPIGVDVEIDIAGAPRLDQFLGALLRLLLAKLGRQHRAMAQPHQQIVTQGAAKQVWRRVDIADASADDRERQFGEVRAADRNPPARRQHQPSEQQRQLVLAAAALADERNVLVEPKGKADRVNDTALVVASE